MEKSIVETNTKMMKKLMVFSLIYLEFAVLVSTYVHLDLLDALIALIKTASRTYPKFLAVLGIFGVVAVVVSFFSRRFAFRATLKLVFFGLAAGILMQTGFTLLKATLPSILPFYADPFLAKWDAILHGGLDPWYLANKMSAFVAPEAVMFTYLKIWSPPAIFLPLIICLFDGDAARVKRTIILYVLAWVLIGNVFALAGMSAGPVYYDRLLGGERFGGLANALVSNGQHADILGHIQTGLWEIYIGKIDLIGPGISAFPSVHVAMATVFAIYLSERSRLLAVIGIGYLVTILFLSVYTGYHYAVDGYFSIIMMVGVWAFLKRKSSVRSVTPLAQPA